MLAGVSKSRRTAAFNEELSATGCNSERPIVSSDGEGGAGSAFPEARVDLGTLRSGGVSDTKASGLTVPLPAHAALRRVPEVTDDYIRNFFLRNGMLRTLEMFEVEWYERFGSRDGGEKPPLFLMPDNYTETAALLNRIEELECSMRQHAELTTKLTKQWMQARRDCDFHRVEHSRVVQEKNKLSKLLKQAHQHTKEFDPTFVEMRQRYELLLKSKALLSLEKDKLVKRVAELEAEASVGGSAGAGAATSSPLSLAGTLKNLQNVTKKTLARGGRRPVAGSRTRSPKLDAANALQPSTDANVAAGVATFVWPADVRPPPPPPGPRAMRPAARRGDDDFTGDAQEHPASLPPPQWTCKSFFLAHTMAITKIALHPRKPAVASCSDDGTWALWTLPQGEAILSGIGHKNWVACVDMHPAGTMAATGSGDKSLKLWDFATNACTAALTAHTDGVWCVNFQETGKLLASGSLDYTARVWDLETAVCRRTLRGHVDGVNSVQWLPCTNLLCTGSGDKTVSVWDARMNCCAKTLYGHRNAVLCVSPFSSASAAPTTASAGGGDDNMVASCDAEGVVKVWDLRTMGACLSVRCGSAAANHVAIDGSCQYAAVAGDDGIIRLINLRHYGVNRAEEGDEKGTVYELVGHEGAVQCVGFDPSTSDFLVSCGSDRTIRYWS